MYRKTMENPPYFMGKSMVSCKFSNQQKMIWLTTGYPHTLETTPEIHHACCGAWKNSLNPWQSNPPYRYAVCIKSSICFFDTSTWLVSLDLHSPHMVSQENIRETGSEYQVAFLYPSSFRPAAQTSSQKRQDGMLLEQLIWLERWSFTFRKGKTELNLKYWHR